MPCLEAEDAIDRPPQHPLSAAIQRDCGAPADVPSNELLGLEYLFGQSAGESGPFSLKDIVNDGPGPEEEVVQPGQPHPESDEAYQSDVEAHDDVLDVIMPHITLTSDETSTVHPPAFVSNCVSARINYNALVAGQCTHFNFIYFNRKMPAVQTLCPAFQSWNGSALCWWRLA